MPIPQYHLPASTAVSQTCFGMTSRLPHLRPNQLTNHLLAQAREGDRYRRSLTEPCSIDATVVSAVTR